MKISRYRIPRGPAKAYTDVIRGVPVVMQLMLIYFVVLVIWTSKTLVGIIALGLNSVVYMVEIFRSGIFVVGREQMEVGCNLGLTHGQTIWSIILPRGIKDCPPTYASELIVLVRETAVVGYIGMTDLTKAYSMVQSRTMDVIPPLTIIVAACFCITKVLSVIFAKTERRLRESDRC